MITLCVMPNFKGDRKETMQAFVVCVLIDSLYCIPFIHHYL